MICYVLAMGKQHLGLHVVVGYSIKFFWPGLFYYVTRSPGDCYEQCGCVGAWAKHGVFRRCSWRCEEQIENKEWAVRRIEAAKGKYARTCVFLTIKTKDFKTFYASFHLK